MFKLRSIVSFFLLVILIPYQGGAPVIPFPAQDSVAINQHFVNVSIDKIQFLGKTGDVIGDGIRCIVPP